MSGKFQPGTSFANLVNWPSKDAAELMNPDELKAKLCRKLKNDGVLDKLKALIRQNLVCELNPHRIPFQTPDSIASLPLQVINWLFEEHLRRNGFDFTLSVFNVESGNSGCVRQKMFSLLDVLKCLEIDATSALGQELLQDYANKSSKLFLWKILIASSGNKSRECNKSQRNEECGDNRPVKLPKSESNWNSKSDSALRTDAQKNVDSSKEREQNITLSGNESNVVHMTEMLDLLRNHVSKFDSVIRNDGERRQMLDTKEESLQKDKQELEKLRFHLQEEELRLNQLKIAMLQVVDLHSSLKKTVGTQTLQYAEDNASQKNSSTDVDVLKCVSKFGDEIATLKKELEAVVQSVQNCKMSSEYSTLQNSIEKLTLAVQASFVARQPKDSEELKQSNYERLEHEFALLRRSYRHDLALWEQNRELLEQALLESRKNQELSMDRQYQFVNIGRELREAVKELQSHIEILQTSAQSEVKITPNKNVHEGHEIYFDTSLSASHLPPELQLGINSVVGSRRLMSELNETRCRVQNLCRKSERMETTYNGFLSSYTTRNRLSSLSHHPSLISPELRVKWREYLQDGDQRNLSYSEETPIATESTRLPNYSTPIWPLYEREKVNISRNLTSDFEEHSFRSRQATNIPHMTRMENSVMPKTITMRKEDEPLLESPDIDRNPVINNDDLKDAESPPKLSDKTEENVGLANVKDDAAYPVINLDSLWKSGDNFEM